LEKITELLPQPKAPDGTEWSWTKPDHVQSVLTLLGADLEAKGYPKTPKSGEPSITKDALATIKAPKKAAKWVAAYLEYNALRKRSNDFISKYGFLVGKEGTIRGSYIKNVSTGRLSCRRPNLQQVPKRGELQGKEGMRIRDIFRAKDGDVFVVADFEQVELLLAATVAQEETMLAIFERGDDVHAETASWVLGKPKEEVTKEQRALAKALNFGLVYGCSAEKLQESATSNYGVPITLKEAKRYRKTFFEKYPRLATWHKKVETECTAGHQYTSTPLRPSDAGERYPYGRTRTPQRTPWPRMPRSRALERMRSSSRWLSSSRIGTAARATRCLTQACMMR